MGLFLRIWQKVFCSFPGYVRIIAFLLSSISALILIETGMF